MTISQLKTQIDSVIKANGIRSITGTNLNTQLDAIIDNYNANNTRIFYQSSTIVTSDLTTHDILINTTDNSLYIYNGTSWIKVFDFDIDTSNLVPYTGATSDVNIGTHKLTSNDITITGLPSKTLLGTNANGDIIEASTSMPANTVKVNATASTANAQDLPIGINQVVGRLSGNMQAIDTVTTTISVGDFTGVYAGLAVESNWTNNFTNAVTSSNSLDFHFGAGANGTLYYCYYGQSGWNRVYTDNRITLSSLIVILETSANWMNDTYNAVSGDIGQMYVNSNYIYRCIDGSLHTWYRDLKVSNTVTSTDITFLSKPQIEIAKVTTDTFTVEAKFDITQITVEALTTTAGNISIGSAAGLSDIVPVTALPVVIGTTKRLLYLEDADYPTRSNRTMYITLTGTLQSVNLHLVLQKIFN